MRGVTTLFAARRRLPRPVAVSTLLPGPGHAPDNIVVHFPDSCSAAARSSRRRPATSGSPATPTWRRGRRPSAASATDTPTVVVPGHGPLDASARPTRTRSICSPPRGPPARIDVPPARRSPSRLSPRSSPPTSPIPSASSPTAQTSCGAASSACSARAATVPAQRASRTSRLRRWRSTAATSSSAAPTPCGGWGRRAARPSSWRLPARRCWPSTTLTSSGPGQHSRRWPGGARAEERRCGRDAVQDVGRRHRRSGAGPARHLLHRARRARTAMR